MLQAILDALRISGNMFWEVFWPLALGFLLSGIIQALVSRKRIAKLLGTNSIKSNALATGFGAASSSCSYAAVAVARSIFRKGASFASSMIFEIASTNLVIELGIILIILLGWQFAAAEYLGGILMIIFLALIFRFTLTRKLVDSAREQASRGLLGRMEGHAAMDMSIRERGSFRQRLFSRKGFVSVSHFYVTDWYSVWVDIALGFLIAGALAAWVPASLWQAIFFENNATLAFIEGPLIGPLVAIISFVCSVGNVPLAAVLWSGGISFGGVVSFIFADLVVLPILNIYRKYYGWRMASYIFITFYAAMAAAGYAIEILFSLMGIIPTSRALSVIAPGIQWNYTSFLNIAFIVLSAINFNNFVRTGGMTMIKMMNRGEAEDHVHSHH